MPGSNRKLLQQYGILPKWLDMRWEQFTNDDDALQKVLKYRDRATEIRKDGVGLYLHGENGRGKTLLVMLLLKDLFERGFRIRAVTLGRLISMYTAGWSGAEKTDEFYSFIHEPDFLEVEEVGKEYKSGESDLGKTVFDTVIRYRLQCQKPLLITTNLEPKLIREVYTQDIASMLYEACLILKVSGEDKRPKINQALKRKYDI